MSCLVARQITNKLVVQASLSAHLMWFEITWLKAKWSCLCSLPAYPKSSTTWYRAGKPLSCPPAAKKNAIRSPFV